MPEAGHLPIGVFPATPHVSPAVIVRLNIKCACTLVGMPIEHDPVAGDAAVAVTPPGCDVFTTYIGSYEPLHRGDAAVDAQLAPAPEVPPGITSPLPTVDEVDVWLTEWQVAEDHLQVVLDEIIAWDLIPMDHDWIARLFADRRTVPLELDTYAGATRDKDAADWTRLGGTVVRIDQISIRYVPSTEPREPGVVPARGAAVVHTVASVWPMQPHHGSICGWIIRIRRP